MESGNSGSMQSDGGSGGDDQAEYDSRLLFQLPTTVPPPPLPPSSSYHQNLIQPDLFTWAPDPSSLLRSSGDHPDNSNYLSFTGTADVNAAGTSSAPPLKQNAAKAPPGPTKNPKKRTRASRRAPTTVLTTDTANFRAMVQEFTGIPDPPFSSSPRLDLLATAGSSTRQLAAAIPFRSAASNSLLMNQEPALAPRLGHGLPDPTALAFERFFHQQQPLLFPPPESINLAGGFDPPDVGFGFGSSSSEPQNNNYTDSAPPPGNPHPRPNR